MIPASNANQAVGAATDRLGRMTGSAPITPRKTSDSAWDSAWLTESRRYVRVPAFADRQSSLRQALEEKTRDVRHQSLRLSAVQAENRFMRENIRALMQDNARLREAVAAMRQLETLS